MPKQCDYYNTIVLGRFVGSEATKVTAAARSENKLSLCHRLIVARTSAVTVNLTQFLAGSLRTNVMPPGPEFALFISDLSVAVASVTDGSHQMNILQFLVLRTLVAREKHLESVLLRRGPRRIILLCRTPNTITELWLYYD